MADIAPRKGLPSVHLTDDQFRARVRERFVDPAFRTIDPEIDLVTRIARDAYEEGRKSPNTRKAGAGYHDPDYELSVEWIEASARIAAAAAKWRDETLPTRILLISGSPRSDQTCPGEMSKSWRMLELAKTTIAAAGNVEIDELDLGRITAEYGRSIHPCKGCVSTAMPLCHWPCSCYPNHSLGQVHDWMNEIYERWTAAHGVMIVTPVHWYQAPSVLKLMIDRLVCADGGNADPTLTGGKDPKQAKKVELDGWDYPKHLAGRAFSVVVHGDGTSLWTLTHHTDFAKGFVGLMGNSHAIGDAFHITSDEWLNWNQIYEMFAHAAGVTNPELVHIPSELINAYDANLGAGLLGDKAASMIFDNSKVKRLVPDFVCTTPFSRGAEEVMKWHDADPARQALDPRMDQLFERMIADYRKAWPTQG